MFNSLDFYYYLATDSFTRSKHFLFVWCTWVIGFYLPNGCSSAAMLCERIRTSQSGGVCQASQPETGGSARPRDGLFGPSPSSCEGVRNMLATIGCGEALAQAEGAA
jgi:hypothetical protein